MSMLRVLTRRGDDCVTWDQHRAEVGDPEALAAIREAERIFNQARTSGAAAFTVAPDHSIKRLEQFDQKAEQIVMVPRVVGG